MNDSIRPTRAEAARDQADTAPDESWIIEAADPEVGIFGDSIVHDCAANAESEDDDVEAAVDTSFREEARSRGHFNVICTTTFTCRACGSTTSFDESWPAEMFS
jgi:hypothetical protein